MFHILSSIKNKGFTLVEMLVVVLIFSIVIGATIGVFVSAIRVQRYTLATQQLLDQTSYVMEYIGRLVRMAKKDIDWDCLTTAKTNYEETREGKGLMFKNYNHDCQEFFLESERLKVRQKIGTVDEQTLSLTSGKLKVSSFEVSLSGEEQTPDTLQPRVTFLLKIEGTDPSFAPKIRIQTTISQRDLDIKE